MENQITEQPSPEKMSVLNILIILVLAAVLVIVGFIFWDRKPANTTGTATLSWNANTETDLSGYKIYYGTSSRTENCPPAGYPEKVDVGKTATPDNPSYTINNLQGDKTYYFSITSYDTSGNESCFSDEMSKKLSE